jgi:hypothetical protein
MMVMDWLSRRGFVSQLGARLRSVSKLTSYPDLELDAREIIESVRPYTMTSPERLYALIQAVKYLVAGRVEGDIVECGVWRGGSIMAAALTLLANHETHRRLYLFDTFEGMPQPTDKDVDVYGRRAAQDFGPGRRGRQNSILAMTQDAVRSNVALVAYPPDRIHFVQGRVESTIPKGAPDQIALLRLDTDWYESTRHELAHLFPRLVKGGVLIIDDYGHWQGAKRAVDEYFTEEKVAILLNRIDYTGRIGIKV